MFYLIIILFGVAWILTSVIVKYGSKKSPISHKYLNHGTLIELIWTISPALVLILIAFPSFKLLYLMDEVNDPAMTILAEGLFNDGPNLYISNKIEDLNSLALLLIGQRKNIIATHTKNHVKFHTRVKAASRIGPHHEEIVSVIIGSILGNCVADRLIEATRLCYRQSIVDKDYLFWLNHFFYSRGYTNSEPRLLNKNLKRDNKNHSMYELVIILHSEV